MTRYLFYFFVLMIHLSATCLPPAISEEDQRVLDKFWEYAARQQLDMLSVPERIPVVARFFINTPYASNTLNTDSVTERLVINLQALDCVTFVENVLALSRVSDYNKTAEKEFVRNLQQIRYRDGKIRDYTSRLHYSSDWLYEMEKQKILRDVTPSYGGISYPLHVNFMSQHPQSYPQLRTHPEYQRKMQAIETEINRRSYHYIPKNKIKEMSTSIENGDIILITTGIKGLDTSHLGIAVKKDDSVYLLHASSTGRKVMLSQKPLHQYLADIQTQTGIMIARSIEK